MTNVVTVLGGQCPGVNSPQTPANDRDFLLTLQHNLFQMAPQQHKFVIVQSGIETLLPGVDIVAEPAQGFAQGSGKGIAGQEGGNHQYRVAVTAG